MRRRRALSFASHEHFIFVSRAFHLRRTCVFSCITRVTRLCFSGTSLHPGVVMGPFKMWESKELDEGFRVYTYLPNISIRSAVKREVVVLLVPSCYLHQDILLQD